MYGLLLDTIQKFILEQYGEKCWVCIRRRANLTNHWFVTHEVYPETVIHDLVEAAAAELGETQSYIMMKFGEYFAQNIGRYGYARLLRVLGRDMRDFLNGLDDLHEYLRFSYPKMKPPSFYCENETPEGMILHYTTRRKGFLNYVIGQLRTVGRIYGKEMEIVEVSNEVIGEEIHYVLNLKFDNSEVLKAPPTTPAERAFEIDCTCFFDVFPFSVVFDENMTIYRVGSKIKEVLPELKGQQLDHMFTIRKPQVGQLSWSTICSHPNCVFELESTEQVFRLSISTSTTRNSPGLEYSGPPPTLKLKGQMLLMKGVDSIAFLCSPAMDSPEDLYESGIFINDLAMHDSSRDCILAGSQQNPELNLALHQEKIRSAQLEESSQRTDRLLYQMIPKPIADQLRNGETPLNTCREFESVSILFSDVVSFTPMCSRLRPMEVVCVLNAMCVAFDQLCDNHDVYKVETIGDGYMVICGAPDVRPNHAINITDFAFSIIEATSKINDPSTNKPLRIRVGIHSGTVVAGVVGASILRYDVFGDSVNVAARMEATGEPMRIHISEATAQLLQGTKFLLEERGKVEVKGKGLLLTYWVKGKKDRQLPEQQAVLNPYQREVQPKSRFPKVTPPPSRGESPTSSPPLSPAPAQRQFLSISQAGTIAKRRKTTPEPHEWPQADLRLASHDERRATIPDLVSQQLTVPRFDRRSTLTTAEVTELQTLLRAHGHRLSDINPPSLQTPMSGSDSSASIMTNQLSELNLMNIRGSLSLPLAPILEGRSVSHQQLSVFAAIAEESARQARRVADWASELAKLESRCEHTRTGSSVDVCPFQTSSVNSTSDTPPVSPLQTTPNVETTPTIKTHPPTPDLSKERTEGSSLEQPISTAPCIIL